MSSPGIFLSTRDAERQQQKFELIGERNATYRYRKWGIKDLVASNGRIMISNAVMVSPFRRKVVVLGSVASSFSFQMSQQFATAERAKKNGAEFSRIRTQSKILSRDSLPLPNGKQ